MPKLVLDTCRIEKRKHLKVHGRYASSEDDKVKIFLYAVRLAVMLSLPGGVASIGCLAVMRSICIGVVVIFVGLGIGSIG